jgi:hypothetical protein
MGRLSFGPTHNFTPFVRPLKDLAGSSHLT